MIDDVIAGLHKLASELLGAATDLDNTISNNQVVDLEKAKNLLGNVCSKLGEVHDLLSGQSSPLSELIRNLDGGGVVSTLSKVADFVDQHKATLQRLGLKGNLLQETVDTLRFDAGDQSSDERLDNPQGLEAGPVLHAIEEFRSLVCKLATVTDFADQVINAGVVASVAKGIAGVAVIVVDVTGAATAGVHDPTLWVLVKAVKSTWSGIRMVKSCIGRLKETFNIREKLLVERDQDNLRRAAQNNKPRFPDR